MDPIEKPTLTALIRYYDSIKEQKKQAFVSFRSYEFYAEEIRTTIEKCKVIELESGGMNYLVGHGIKRTKISKENKIKSKKVLKTQFSYNPLWKMLIDRGLKKRELQEMSEVSATSIAKLGRNENVATEVLIRICESLDCNIQDIIERIPIKHDETAKQEG